MNTSNFIKQLNDLVNENIKLKKENEELKKQTEICSNNEELLKEIEVLKKQINTYEEQLKTLDIEKIKEQIINYNNAIKILKLKLLFIKNEYNKLSDCTNLLYTYYKTAKLLNPNLLEISKLINQDRIIPYIIKYNIPQPIEFDENGDIKNDTTGEPIGEITINLHQFKDVILTPLSEIPSIPTYETRFFGNKKEENSDDDDKENESLKSEKRPIEKND